MFRLAALVLLFLALSVAPASAAPVRMPQTPEPVTQLSGARTSTAALQHLGTRVLDELNRVRAARGLRSLRAAPALAASARRHSRQMARGGFFAHE